MITFLNRIKRFVQIVDTLYIFSEVGSESLNTHIRYTTSEASGNIGSVSANTRALKKFRQFFRR
jgi:hypothetical protein